MLHAERELEEELNKLMRVLKRSDLEAEAEMFAPLEMLRLAQDKTVVAGQIGRGIRDENQLTDMVFFARHPERNGRRLDARETALIAEWTGIRDQIVRQILAGQASPRPAPARAGGVGTPAWVHELLPMLDKYRGATASTPIQYGGELPLYFLLGWISVESGGKLEGPTSIGELGYFQVYPENSTKLGIDHARLRTDPDYSVWGGIRLVRYLAAQARAKGFPDGTELLWRVTKWRHWLPAVVDLIVQDMLKNAVDPTKSWDNIENYVRNNQNRLNNLIRATYHKTTLGNWDVMVGVNNVNKTIQNGKGLAAALGL